MSGKSKIDVFNKMTKTALDEEISNYVAYHRYYQRLIAVKIVSEGNTIIDAANILGKSYQTVHRWIKTCESEGLEGLKPSFGGGRPSKLTYDQLIELDKIIEKTPNMSMKDVHLLVNEKFNVNYSLKQIGKIVKKLGYNYSRHDGGQSRRLPAVGHAGGLRGQGRRPPGRRRGHQGGQSRDESRLDPGQLRLPRRPRRRGARGAHDRGEQSALPAGERRRRLRRTADLQPHRPGPGRPGAARRGRRGQPGGRGDLALGDRRRDPPGPGDRQGADHRHRERPEHGGRRPARGLPAHRHRGGRRGHRRRRTGGRLHVLVGHGQLRVDLRLRAQVRHHRRRPGHPGAHAQGVRPRLRRDRPDQRGGPGRAGPPGPVGRPSGPGERPGPQPPCRLKRRFWIPKDKPWFEPWGASASKASPMFARGNASKSKYPTR